MSKYKKGDRFEFEIEEVYTDCLDSDFYKIKNITGIYSEGQLDMLKQVKPQSGKYDCNKALDYYHEQIRMCDYYDDCGGCPLRTSADFCAHSSSQTRIDAVQAWSDSHPEEAPKHEKTLKEDFFEKFPNAQQDPNGIPRSNPCDIYGENVKCSDFDCGSGECWNIPLKEVKET